MGQTQPQQQNGPSVNRGGAFRVLLSILFAAVVIAGAWFYFRLGAGKSNTTENEAIVGDPALLAASRPLSVSPASPASSAEVLGLNPELPKDVEGLNQEAFATCERLVRDLPGRPEVYAVAAFIFNRHGLAKEAAKNWEQALKVNPRFAPAYCGLGIAAADNNEDEKAIEMLSKAIELDPAVDHAHGLLVEVLLRQGKAEAAVAAARKYVEAFPKLGDSHYWLGQAHFDLRQYEEAGRSYEEAIEVEPGYTAAYHSLAAVRTRLGDREGAAEYLKKFAELKEKDLEKDRSQSRGYKDLQSQLELAASYHLAAGRVHLQFGKPEKAEAHWFRGAAIAPELIACREALVSYYEQQNRLLSAIGQLEELVARHPENGAFWTRMGRLQHEVGNNRAAEEAFRRAIEVAPEKPQGYAALIELYVQSGRDAAETVALAEEAAEKSPSAVIYMLLSAAHEQNGNRKGAIAAVEEALKLEPDNEQIKGFHERIREKDE